MDANTMNFIELRGGGSKSLSDYRHGVYRICINDKKRGLVRGTLSDKSVRLNARTGYRIGGARKR